MHAPRALWLASLLALVSACKRAPAAPRRAPPRATAPASNTPVPPPHPDAPTGVLPRAQPLSPITAATPTLTPTAAGSLSIGAGAGTTYRSPSGAWILRTNVIVRNTGTEPAEVAITQFRAGALTQEADESTFPARTLLTPNMTIQGDISFTRRATDPKPIALPLTFAGAPAAAWRSDVSLIFSPAPPAHGYAPTSVVDALGVGLTQPAVTWLQPDGGPRIVQFNVAINNTTSVPIVIPRGYLLPTIGSDHGAPWPAGSSLPETLPIPLGGHVQGTAAFAFGAGTAPPTSIPVTFGPSNAPQFNQTIPVVEVSPPAATP